MNHTSLRLERNKLAIVLNTGKLLLCLGALVAGPVFSMGAPAPTPKPTPAPAPTPKPTPAPAPTPKPTPAPTPAPTPPPSGGANQSDYDAYFNTGRQVDAHFSRSELQKSRAPASVASDKCVIDQNTESFSETIGWGVNVSFKPRRQELDYVATSSWDPFDMYNSKQEYAPVSLSSHPLCSVDKASLSVILSTNSTPAKMPSDQAIADVNTFVSRNNALRIKANNGDEVAKKDLDNLWVKFMGCLAYTESLGDADTSTSRSVADQHAPSDYDKPDGVKFYWDKNQPEVSALNIGLFQFAPDAGGNIQGCLRNWNKMHQSCQLPTKGSKGEMIKILGANRQAFNAFCGVNQILNTFSVQVNTRNSYRVHPANVLSGGSLKKSADRCVSLHVRTGRSYNHYGPFQNGTGTNLAKLMSCAVR